MDCEVQSTLQAMDIPQVLLLLSAKSPSGCFNFLRENVDQKQKATYWALLLCGNLWVVANKVRLWKLRGFSIIPSLHQSRKHDALQVCCRLLVLPRNICWAMHDHETIQCAKLHQGNHNGLQFIATSTQIISHIDLIHTTGAAACTDHAKLCWHQVCALQIC